MPDPDLDGAIWRTSSRSGAQGSCVEVATLTRSRQDGGHMVTVRDSKNRRGPALIFTPAEWAAFTSGVKAGRHDLS
jgi:hypothetical protein